MTPQEIFERARDQQYESKMKSAEQKAKQARMNHLLEIQRRAMQNHARQVCNLMLMGMNERLFRPD